MNMAKLTSAPNMEMTTSSEVPTHLAAEDIESVAYNRMLPILVQCFTIIFLGYMSGRLGIMTTREAKGLGLFIRYFSLPSLIFGSLVKIEFTNVNWTFLACIFIAKLSVFAIVAVLTLILTRPTNVGKAGLYAIFTTQSNDFALGYPLLVSLYSQNHLRYSNFLYLIAPIQLVTLNPIGYALMEKQRQKEEHNMTSKIGLCLGLISNPIVIMTVLGIVGNVVFSHQLPMVISQLLEVLGTAFPACALFFLGHTITGKFRLLKGSSVIVPALLIAAKILLLPIIIFELVHRIVPGGTSQDVKDLSSFGFLYGTFPTAPSVFIFATQFDMPINVVAPSMVACTLLSAPLMFVTASMTTLSASNLFQFRTDLLHTLTCVSIIGLLCSVWVIIIFLFGKKWRFVIHRITLCLVCSQLMTSLGGILWTVIDIQHQWAFCIQYVLSVGGIFSARIWTSLLAVSLALLQWRSLCFVSRVYRYIIYIGLSKAVIIVIVLAVRMGSFLPNKNNTDPNFPFGESQLFAAFIVILLTLLVTLSALFIYQHYYSKSQNVDEEYSEAEMQLIEKKKFGQGETVGQNHMNEIGAMEDSTLNFSNTDTRYIPKNCGYSVLCPSRFCCSAEQRKKCNILYCQSANNIQFDSSGMQEQIIANEILKCVILLLLLCMSMAVGLTVCLWKLFLEETTGIYVELEFLDVILNYGQGIFSFFVFGLDNELVMTFCMWFFNQFCGYGRKSSQSITESSAITQQICKQFVTYHKDKCVVELCSDHQVGDHFYESTFRGKELVDWLLAVGLANDRSESQKYGQYLLLGGVISHVNSKSFFYDNMSLYKFC